MVDVSLLEDREVGAPREPPAPLTIQVLDLAPLPRLSGQSKIGLPVGPDNPLKGDSAEFP